MSLQSFEETLITAQGDGTALTNTLTATSIIPAAAKYTIPANYFSIGKNLRLTLKGRISNVVTTPGTLVVDVRFGSVVVFNPAAISLNIVAKTNVSFECVIDLTCRAIGAGTSANMMGVGRFTSESVVGAVANTANTAMMPLSAPAVGTGFDSTSSQTIDVFGTFSVTTATTSIQVHQYILEAMN